MGFEFLGGKIEYFVFPFCIMLKSQMIDQNLKCYNVSIECLKWYIALLVFVNSKPSINP